jgi:hypothetical protein
LPKGEWTAGIDSAEHAALVGQYITALVHVGEHLAIFFGRLILLPTGSPDVARQSFRAVRFAEGKIKLMESVLHNSQVHAEKSSIFDEVIDGYETANGKRNDYEHYTYESGRVFKTRVTTDALRFDEYNRQEVTVKQLERDSKYLDDLLGKIQQATERVAVASLVDL